MALYDPNNQYNFVEPTVYGNDPEPNTVQLLAGGEEMLRVGPDGFWVRGVKVPQDDREALAVYNAFKEWMTWQQLTRQY